jgi:hypothetical protein
MKSPEILKQCNYLQYLERDLDGADRWSHTSRKSASGASNYQGWADVLFGRRFSHGILIGKTQKS